jgi:predicted transposase YdaD
MCEALRELMKDEIAQDLARGRAEGRAEGEAKGRAEGEATGKVKGKAEQAISTAYTLSDMGMTIDMIAKAVHFSVETVTQWLENRPANLPNI